MLLWALASDVGGAGAGGSPEADFQLLDSLGELLWIKHVSRGASGIYCPEN